MVQFHQYRSTQFHNFAYALMVSFRLLQHLLKNGLQYEFNLYTPALSINQVHQSTHQAVLMKKRMKLITTTLGMFQISWRGGLELIKMRRTKKTHQIGNLRLKKHALQTQNTFSAQHHTDINCFECLQSTSACILCFQSEALGL